MGRSDQTSRTGHRYVRLDEDYNISGGRLVRLKGLREQAVKLGACNGGLLGKIGP